ncbi:MAG TPA: hypothetical protein VF306_07740 [Pirellulales bacterium]
MDIEHLLARQFPFLASEGFIETSPASAQYNCIAWAAGQTDEWWWPLPVGAYSWPAGVPRSETLTAFLLAFQSLGYLQCDDEKLEPTFERIALFVADGKPTHAARQLADGSWTSKLGRWIDISHSLRALAGPTYGEVAALMKRPRIAPGAGRSRTNITSSQY